MNRRVWTGVAAGTLAGIAGVGTSLWRHRAENAPAPDIWGLSFPAIDGRTASMAARRGKPLLLNFWATWCAPCAIEMPLLDVFSREAAPRGWSVLALAVDSAEPVHRFLTERALSLPVALAGPGGIELSRRLGNSVGALPFTVAFGANGEVRDRKLGRLDEAILERWLREVH